MLRHVTLHRVISRTILLTGLLSWGKPRLDAQSSAPSRDLVLFNNATIDLVRVYLVDRGSQWLLGRVEAGQSVALSLPPGYTFRSGDPVVLVAVPLGAAWGPGTTAATRRGAIRSEPEPAENLLRMQWKLAGTQLFSTPVSRRPFMRP